MAASPLRLPAIPAVSVMVSDNESSTLQAKSMASMTLCSVFDKELGVLSPRSPRSTSTRPGKLARIAAARQMERFDSDHFEGPECRQHSEPKYPSTRRPRKQAWMPAARQLEMFDSDHSQRPQPASDLGEGEVEVEVAGEVQEEHTSKLKEAPSALPSYGVALRSFRFRRLRIPPEALHRLPSADCHLEIMQV